jgi:hypothetical protein
MNDTKLLRMSSTTPVVPRSCVKGIMVEAAGVEPASEDLTLKHLHV